MRALGASTVLLVLAALPAGAGEAPRPLAKGSVPEPRFADPDRARKLAAAFEDVDRAFREFQGRAKAPGLAWGVVVDGALVHTGGAGVREVGKDAPVDGSSVFRIASMTKSFTALSILRLRDMGRLSLEDPAARYVPELAALAYPTRDSPLITIRHLLTHSAGFPEDNPWGDRQLATDQATMSRWLRSGLPFSNAPGVAFEYSNYGFAILGQVVARVSGERYRDYVDGHILKPLGMTSTKWEAAAVPAERLAHGYRREGDSWVEETPLKDGTFGAMGGLYSTVEDLARYVSFFLSAWPPRDEDEHGPVKRSSVREMQQAARPYRAAAFRASVDAPLRLASGGYGYGLGATQTCLFRASVSHSGGLPGYGSIMRWLPEHGVGIVALANITYGAPGSAAADALEALSKTGALQPRVVEPSAALESARDRVTKLLDSWDDSLYASLAADNLSLDKPQDQRRRQFAELRSRHGACHPDGPIEAENALRGTWWLACEHGRLSLSLTLAPTLPPRVQALEATSALPLAPALDAAASALADRVGKPGASLRDLLAANVDPAASARLLEAAATWGRCRRGPTLESDGSSATVRLDCDKGRLEARLALAAAGGLESLRLAPSVDETCVP